MCDASCAARRLAAPPPPPLLRRAVGRAAHGSRAHSHAHCARRGTAGARSLAVPRNEDPVREAEYNIRTFKKLWAKAKALRATGVDECLRRQDALGSLEILERLDGESSTA